MVKVVIVCTSASTVQGHDTGLWVEELAAPYYIFKDAGYEVVIASIAGGPVPIDAASMAKDFFTAASQKFLHDPVGMGALNHSVKIEDVDWSKDTVDCIYLPGGHGTCGDFVHSPALKKAVETLYAANKIVASVCHGPIGLCECCASDGTTPLVQGKTVTGFSDAEEDAVQLQHIVPFLLESKLKELGAHYEKAADNWQSKVCVDGHLVTGQNPQSSEDVAKKVVQMLS
jgi:putative intracellular protease/amidase